MTHNKIVKAVNFCWKAGLRYTLIDNEFVIGKKQGFPGRIVLIIPARG